MLTNVKASHLLYRGRRRLTVRACTSATVGIVAELMDVHSPLGRRIMAGDIVGDGGRRGFTRLFKGDGAFDIGVTTENCDCGRRTIRGSASLKIWWPGDKCAQTLSRGHEGSMRGTPRGIRPSSYRL